MIKPLPVFDNAVLPNYCETSPVTEFVLCAAMHDHKSAVEFLIAHKANVNHKNVAGTFALYHAAYFNYKGVCEALLKGRADKNLTTKHGKTAAQTAEERGHKELAAFIESWGQVCVSVHCDCLSVLLCRLIVSLMIARSSNRAPTCNTRARARSRFFRLTRYLFLHVNLR